MDESFNDLLIEYNKLTKRKEEIEQSIIKIRKLELEQKTKYKIDGLTKSINELNDIVYDDEVMDTIEYKEKGQEAINKLINKEINEEKYIEILKNKKNLLIEQIRTKENDEKYKILKFRQEAQYQIAPYTKSIKDIEVTRSSQILQDTIEYKQKAQIAINSLMEKQITEAEFNKILDDELALLTKYMDSKRDRTTSIKRTKEIDTEKLTIKYRGYVEYNMPQMTNDKETYIHNDISVVIPKKAKLFEYAERQKNLYSENIKNIDDCHFYCFITLNLKGKKVFNSNTRKVPILNHLGKRNNEFMAYIKKDINEIIERLPNYEKEETELICHKIYITLTIGKWDSINNWYTNKTKKYRKFEDFTLFTANDKNILCVKQCVEELGGIWDDSKTFEEMIPQSKIIIYIPTLLNMVYVNSLKDLMSNYDEEILSTECKSIARIIKWNNHIGVITKIDKTKPKTKTQKQKRIIAENNSTIEVFMDIEAFTDEDGKQIPYLICWSTEKGDVIKAKGLNCINTFVDQLIKMGEYTKTITLYAWFGSGYDYQHILPYLKEKCTKDNYIIKNSSIIYAEIQYDELTIILKDPYLFILTSLDRASKAFNVINKGSFPHSIIKNWDDLNQVLPNWIKIQQNIIEDKNDNKLEIKRIPTTNYENIINNKSIINKAIEYCEVDVLAMREVWKKFKILVKDNLGVEIGTKIFTLSQLSMKIMEASLSSRVKLYVPTKNNYQFIKNAIYGGRVVAKNGIYTEPIAYADVVSLYPSAMKLLEHSYGKPIEVNTINYEKHGIYEVTLVHKNDREPENYQEFVPRRLNGKLEWGWFKNHTGTYHTYDLLIAAQEGYNITCHKGIEYKEKGFIFNKFIDKLYQLKDTHTDCNCLEQPCPIRMVAKIALNGGGYGKFVQKPIQKEVYIVEKDIVAGECLKLKTNDEGKIYLGNILINMPKFYNLEGHKYDKMVVEKDEDPVYSTQCGISILSASRYRLYNLCKQFKGLEVIYSDTDSIFVKKSSINWNLFKENCGTNLGQLDNTIDKTENAIISYMIIGGPKMYAYEYYDNNNKKQIALHCKGVPTSMLSINQFEHLLGKDNKLLYHFEIIKRKLTGITVKQIIKNIKQT